MSHSSHLVIVEHQFLTALRDRLGFERVSERASGGWRDVFWGDESGGNRDTTIKLFTTTSGSMMACLHLHSVSRRFRDGKKPNVKGNILYSLEELSIAHTVNLASITSLTEEHLAKCSDAAHGAISSNRGRIAQTLAIDGMGSDDPGAVSSYATGKGIKARHSDTPPVHHQSARGSDILCIPMYQLAKTGNAIRCHLLNRQIIETRGGAGASKKRFLRGPATKGLCFPFGMGFDVQTQTLRDTHPERIFLGEGYATMATVHEATGKPSITAFNAGNMIVVAGQLARMFPKTEIVICADYDITTERKRGYNPGINAAIAAAKEIQVQRALEGTPLAAQPATHVVTPLLEELPAKDKVSDFNDAWSKRYHDAMQGGADDGAAREQAYALVRAAIDDGVNGGHHAVDSKKWKLAQNADFDRLKQEAVREQLHTFMQDLNDAVGPGFASLVNGADAPGLAVVYQQGSRAACQQTLRLNAPGAAIMAAANVAGFQIGDDKATQLESALGANWGVECLMLHARTKDGSGLGAVWPLWIATQRDREGNTIKARPLTDAAGKHFMHTWLASVVGQAKNYTEASSPYKKDATDSAAHERAAGLRALQRVCCASKALYINMAPQQAQPCRAIWETVTSVHECDDALRGAAAQLAKQDVHLLRRFTLDATGITISKRMEVFPGEGAPKEAASWFKQKEMRPHNVAGAKVYTLDAANLASFARHMGVELEIEPAAFERPVRVVNPEYLETLLPSATKALASGRLTMNDLGDRLAESNTLLPKESKLEFSATQKRLLSMSAITLRRSYGLDSTPLPEATIPRTAPEVQQTVALG